MLEAIMDAVIKICPCCGCMANLTFMEYGDCHPETYHYVECTNVEHCGLQSGEFETQEDAINAWNRRC